MARVRRLAALTLLLILLLLPAPVLGQAQAGDPQVDAILQQMTPQERVGQLFLVTFYGTDTGPNSDIASLIADYHIGGVVLVAANNNFTDSEDILAQTHTLTSNLQRLAAGMPPVSTASPPAATATPTESQQLFVPLFIGIDQEGSGLPGTQILSGLTPMPSLMSLGAAWNPDLAEQAGKVLGQELGALGVNMLLGPSADVVEIPQPFTGGDVGTEVFGGEPFWVSQMTAAYVKGVHEGSGDRMEVIPRSFPGYGGADRLATVEIPTVRRTKDQLIQSDLKPFFAVMGQATDAASVADGVVVGHIKFQGFQGDNLRLATRPISLDPVALQSLVSLPDIASWRDSGGLLVTDSLGVRGVRRLYESQTGSFPGRRIALDAFLAGNDVLYLGDFGANPPSDQTAAIEDTIDFFVQRYQDDPTVQALVNSAVRRIIRKKLDLYGQFSLDATIPDPSGLSSVGTQRDVTFDIARSALTLVSPAQADVVVSPQRGDNIVIFTDTRPVQQCATCRSRPEIAVDALRSAILRSYGPEATGIVSLANIYSFSFQDLNTYLQNGPQDRPAAEGETPSPDPVPVALNSADWVVFVMRDVTDTVPVSMAIKNFLADPPIPVDARIVVMAMGAPYYLDSTEIGKLTAYYALYGYTEPFIDAAARALFGGLTPTGALPVTVSGIDYEIMTATSPDPNQLINLTYTVEGPTGEVTSTPGTALAPEIGDTIRLQTAVIVDHNGHPVPDGTPVEFVFEFVSEGLRDLQQATTTAGVAEISVPIARPGELHISVVSGDAQNSDQVQLVVPDTGSAEISVLPPDVTPTETLSPTDTPQPPATEPAASTPEPVQTPTPTPVERAVNFGDLFLSILGLALIGGAAFVSGYVQGDVNRGLLLALPAILGGLLAYNYYALLLPGSIRWYHLWGTIWGPALAAWVGGLAGLGIVLLALRSWSEWSSWLRGHQRR